LRGRPRGRLTAASAELSMVGSGISPDDTKAVYF
jgi:hypothetical protein